MEPTVTQTSTRFLKVSKVRQSIARIVLALGDEYVILLVLLLLLRFTIGERWEVIAAFNSILHLLVLPAIAWLGVCLLRRRWVPVALALIPSLFFVVSYGIVFVPRAAAVQADRPRIKLLTYNVHSEKAALDPMSALIRESGADVVALQELSVEAAEHFRQKLSADYPYLALRTDINNPIVGQGVLSRHPIANDDYWQNDDLPAKLAHQRVEVTVNGKRVTLYNAHPIHPILKENRLFFTELRTREISSVLARAKSDSGPVIIVGDFNMSDQSDDYRMITGRYADAYRQVGWGMGFTFPDFTQSKPDAPIIGSLPLRPMVRLDYVFHSGHLRPVQAQVWPTSGGSDHRPVLAELELLIEAEAKP